MIQPAPMQIPITNSHCACVSDIFTFIAPNIKNTARRTNGTTNGTTNNNKHFLLGKTITSPFFAKEIDQNTVIKPTITNMPSPKSKYFPSVVAK